MWHLLRVGSKVVPKTSGRLLALLSLLQTRRDWPGTLLAERLDISPRTVRRDVDRLRELGYPIAAVKGPDRAYRLSAGTELPPLLFDDEQAVALTVALQIAATTLGDSAGDAAARALATVRQVMPSRLRHRINSLQITAVERPATRPAASVDGDVLLAISFAVQAHEILRIGYRSETVDKPPAPRRAASCHHMGRTLVPRRVGPRPVGLADLPRRPDPPAPPQRTPLHAQGTARQRRDHLRHRQVPRR
jgi:biotin operon repressor